MKVNNKYAKGYIFEKEDCALPSFVSGSKEYFSPTKIENSKEVEIINEDTIYCYYQYEWEHINIWGCPYKMRCDSLEVKLYWVRDKRKYYRFIVPKFEKLQYQGLFDWQNLTCVWGHKDILNFSKTHVTVNYGMKDKKFNNIKELKENIINFGLCDINFDEFCNEIFADG